MGARQTRVTRPRPTGLPAIVTIKIIDLEQALCDPLDVVDRDRVDQGVARVNG